MPEMQHPGAADHEKTHRARRGKRGEQNGLAAGTRTHGQGGRQDADGKGHDGELEGTGRADEKACARAMRQGSATAAGRPTLAQLEQFEQRRQHEKANDVVVIGRRDQKERHAAEKSDRGGGEGDKPRGGDFEARKDAPSDQIEQ